MIGVLVLLLGPFAVVRIYGPAAKAHGARDIACPESDESPPDVRAVDALGPANCCCRVRCTSRGSCGQAAARKCASIPSCYGFVEGTSWATLKGAPPWPTEPDDEMATCHALSERAGEEILDLREALLLCRT